MAASRLRKTFRYPSEEDSNASDDNLDEEHQEKLITTLQTEDERKSTFYRNLFLSIPAIAILLFLPTLAIGPSARDRLLSLLSITSLFSTAYILHFLPIERPERKGKTAVYKLEAAKGPVEKYLVYLNAGLAGLLLLAALLSWRRESVEDAWREALPAIILGLTLFVREQLAPLDLEELQKVRFELKGA